MDIYEYDSKNFLTLIDVFSKYGFAFHVEECTIAAITPVYNQWVSMFDEPKLLLCDNGPYFNGIKTPMNNTPRHSPQTNGLVERMHREIGNQCRIHHVEPPVGITFLRTPRQRALFFGHLKLRYNEPPICVADDGKATYRKFNVHDLVWCWRPRRSRKKCDSTYTGPHRVLEKLGDTQYLITHTNTSSIRKAFRVNLNAIKRCVLPDTSDWAIKPVYFNDAVHELRSDPEAPVFINFAGLSDNTLDLVSYKDEIGNFYLVVPEIPCLPCYEIVNNQLPSDKCKLPDEPDTFVTANDAPVGRFPWRHNLYYFGRT
mmetsp:Transcript_14287/g.27016  ORF Transcript_14287/g.27016 Transcript_14287/m.27016 type:complete len:314 (-) Transcript_14287:528-1469(-)